MVCISGKFFTWSEKIIILNWNCAKYFGGCFRRTGWCFFCNLCLWGRSCESYVTAENFDTSNDLKSSHSWRTIGYPDIIWSIIKKTMVSQFYWRMVKFLIILRFILFNSKVLFGLTFTLVLPLGWWMLKEWQIELFPCESNYMIYLSKKGLLATGDI